MMGESEHLVEISPSSSFALAMIRSAASDVVRYRRVVEQNGAIGKMTSRDGESALIWFLGDHGQVTFNQCLDFFPELNRAAVLDNLDRFTEAGPIKMMQSHQKFELDP